MSSVRSEIPYNNVVDGTRIEGIPAEKRNVHDNNSTFINKSEYINGANVMVSEKAGDKLLLDIKKTGDIKNYKIRYHVATNANTSLKLHVNGIAKGNTSLPNTDALKGNDRNVITGAQGTYKLVDGPTIELKDGYNTVQVTNADGNKIALDRIEFIPTTEAATDVPISNKVGWQPIKNKWYYFAKTGDGSGSNVEGFMLTGWEILMVSGII
ncbi:delta endotoxin C-terminal domain-containing protein [Bacillus cereus]